MSVDLMSYLLGKAAAEVRTTELLADGNGVYTPEPGAYLAHHAHSEKSKQLLRSFRRQACFFSHLFSIYFQSLLVNGISIIV